MYYILYIMICIYIYYILYIVCYILYIKLYVLYIIYHDMYIYIYYVRMPPKGLEYFQAAGEEAEEVGAEPERSWPELLPGASVKHRAPFKAGLRVLV